MRLGEFHVLVQFSSGFSADDQSKALFDLELGLRSKTGKDARVYKELMGDDSRLRSQMTAEARAKL